MPEKQPAIDPEDCGVRVPGLAVASATWEPDAPDGITTEQQARDLTANKVLECATTYHSAAGSDEGIVTVLVVDDPRELAEHLLAGRQLRRRVERLLASLDNDLDNTIAASLREALADTQIGGE